MTIQITSHWVWGSWWRRVLRRRTYYHMFSPEGGMRYMKFDELGGKWSFVGPGEYQDTIKEVFYEQQR